MEWTEEPWGDQMRRDQKWKVAGPVLKTERWTPSSCAVWSAVYARVQVSRSIYQLIVWFLSWVAFDMMRVWSRHLISTQLYESVCLNASRFVPKFSLEFGTQTAIATIRSHRKFACEQSTITHFGQPVSQSCSYVLWCLDPRPCWWWEQPEIAWKGHAGSQTEISWWSNGSPSLRTSVSFDGSKCKGWDCLTRNFLSTVFTLQKKHGRNQSKLQPAKRHDPPRLVMVDRSDPPTAMTPWRKPSGTALCWSRRCCKDGAGGDQLSSVWVGVCSAETTKTYPVALTVIYCRINLYLEVALSGLLSGMIWNHDRLTMSIRVSNVYDRRRLIVIIIAQLMNMHWAVVECKSPD